MQLQWVTCQLNAEAAVVTFPVFSDNSDTCFQVWTNTSVPALSFASWRRDRLLPPRVMCAAHHRTGPPIPLSMLGASLKKHEKNMRQYVSVHSLMHPPDADQDIFQTPLKWTRPMKPEHVIKLCFRNSQTTPLPTCCDTISFSQKKNAVTSHRAKGFLMRLLLRVLIKHRAG